MNHRSGSLPKLRPFDIALLAGLICLAGAIYHFQSVPTDQRPAADRPIRVDSDGTIDLPPVGRIQAGGLVTDPHVSVVVVEPRVTGAIDTRS
jgi:hypothetical protein